MAFTLAHPFVALPFAGRKWKYLSVSALITGSMAPDFEYLLRLQTTGYYGHHADALSWYTLPLAFCALMIYQLFVRNRLIDHLPGPLYRRFADLKSHNYLEYARNNLGVVVFSLVVGILSHLAWDALCHPWGWGINQFDWWSANIQFSNQLVWSFNRFFAHATTLMGLGSILIYIAQMPEVTENTGKPSSLNAYWLTVLGCIGAIVMVRYALGTDQRLHAHFVASMLAGLFLGVLVASLFFSRRVVA